MCQPASPGSRSRGKRTGGVPPTPGCRIQRPGPSNWSQASPTGAVLPAVTNGGPCGVMIRTTGSVQVAGAWQVTAWWAESSAQMAAWQAAMTSAGIAPRTATKTSATTGSISSWLSTRSGSQPGRAGSQRFSGAWYSRVGVHGPVHQPVAAHAVARRTGVEAVAGQLGPDRGDRGQRAHRGDRHQLAALVAALVVGR